MSTQVRYLEAADGTKKLQFRFIQTKTRWGGGVVPCGWSRWQDVPTVTEAEVAEMAKRDWEENT